MTIARNGDWMRITFDFERHDPPPRSLVVTVNSRDEAGVPPRTYTFTLEDTGSGTLNTRIPTDPTKHYDVYTSTTRGRPAGAVRVDADAARPRRRQAGHAVPGRRRAGSARSSPGRSR